MVRRVERIFIQSRKNLLISDVGCEVYLAVVVSSVVDVKFASFSESVTFWSGRQSPQQSLSASFPPVKLKLLQKLLIALLLKNYLGVVELFSSSRTSVKFCWKLVDASPSSTVLGVITDAGRVNVTGELFDVEALRGVVEVPHCSLLMVVHATTIQLGSVEFDIKIHSYDTQQCVIIIYQSSIKITKSPIQLTKTI